MHFALPLPVRVVREGRLLCARTVVRSASGEALAWVDAEGASALAARLLRAPGPGGKVLFRVKPHGWADFRMVYELREGRGCLLGEVSSSLSPRGARGMRASMAGDGDLTYRFRAAHTLGAGGEPWWQRVVLHVAYVLPGIDRLVTNRQFEIVREADGRRVALLDDASVSRGWELRATARLTEQQQTFFALVAIAALVVDPQVTSGSS